MVSAYQSLNRSFKKELVYRIGINAGFFSEYNNMILAMLYCLEHKIQFKLCSGPTNFHPTEGWNGFFLPFCDQVEDVGKHYKTWDWKYALKLISRNRQFDNYKSLLPYVLLGRNRLRTQDIYGRMRTPNQGNRYISIPELGICGNLQEACSKMVEITWHYNDEIQNRIQQNIHHINLPELYVGFHIRRGDKQTEKPFIDIKNYVETAECLSELRTAFVSTDDYSVYEYLCSNYREWTFFTLSEKANTGYIQGDFDAKTQNEKLFHYIELFSSIELLAKSELFVGTFTSNIGMYMGMRNPAICTAVDQPNWILW